MYYLEFDDHGVLDESSKIHSISEAIWWCVATMTTVGYGDKVPLSIPGKIVACIAAFFGITTISLYILYNISPVAVMGLNLS